MAEGEPAAAAEKATPWGWIIFFIVLFLLLVLGIYMFFFSDWSKKRKLVKAILATKPLDSTGAAVTADMLNKRTLVQLQAAYPNVSVK